MFKSSAAALVMSGSKNKNLFANVVFNVSLADVVHGFRALFDFPGKQAQHGHQLGGGVWTWSACGAHWDRRSESIHGAVTH